MILVDSTRTPDLQQVPTRNIHRQLTFKDSYYLTSLSRCINPSSLKDGCNSLFKQTSHSVYGSSAGNTMVPRWLFGRWRQPATADRPTDRDAEPAALRHCQGGGCTVHWCWCPARAAIFYRKDCINNASSTFEYLYHTALYKTIFTPKLDSLKAQFEQLRMCTLSLRIGSP